MIQSKMKQEITRKQAEFCHQYLIDLNGKQAAIRAGYSAKTAEFQAARLLSKDKVKAYLASLQSKSRALTDITKEEILTELAAILRSKITDYLNFNGKRIKFKPFDKLTESQIKAIESIKQDKTGQIELKLHGKSWTVDRICKILGFDSATEMRINFDKMGDDELDGLLNRLIKR